MRRNVGVHTPNKYLNLVYPASLLLIVFFSNWYFVNKFIPIQEGWFQYYSLLVKKGFIPYRDFFYFLPPIPLVISNIILSFGQYLRQLA